MDWLNLHISVLDFPQVLRCDPVRRATWLFLLRYCISQENGGIIEDCAAWGDTSWQQIVRVKLREVRAESPLWTWEGDNLRVTFYPSDNLQPPQVVVFRNGQIHHVLGLVKYAEVTFSGMLGRSQRQITDGTF